MSNVCEAMRRIAVVSCFVGVTCGCTKLTAVDWDRIPKAGPSDGNGGAAGESTALGGASGDAGGAPSDTGGALTDTGGAASDAGGAASDTGGAASGGAAGAEP